MTRQHQAQLEALGATVAVAAEGEGWRSLLVAGDGFRVYLRDDDEEAFRALVEMIKGQGEARQIADRPYGSGDGS